MKATVEPLPLVPATWTTGGRRSCGAPRSASRRWMRPSDRSMTRGCSGAKRAVMVSVWFTRALRNRRWAAPLRCRDATRKQAHSMKLSGGGRLARRFRQHLAQPRQRRAHFRPRNHHVDHAMLLQEFSALKTLGQALAHGLLDDPRERLPEGLQRAEFLQQHGMVDM